MPNYTYPSTIDWTQWWSWNQAASYATDRAYDYVHVTAAYWSLYRVARNYPDLGPRFAAGERQARLSLQENSATRLPDPEDETVLDDKRDLDWATVLKRTFEAYIRGERPNMYGEWIKW